jgi:predicted enzyme related to lactoylglutathione lyase
MLNFNSALLFSEDSVKLSDFYKKIFDMEPDWEQGGYFGFQLGTGMLIIGPHDGVHGKNQNPQRLMFNFETRDVQAECERMRKLGAEVIKESYHPKEADSMTIATLSDPDGNYFQLGSPMDENQASAHN